MGLIFDTSDLILAERQNLSVANLLSKLNAMEQIGISVVTIAEFQHGI